jgi:hypothetical protein
MTLQEQIEYMDKLSKDFVRQSQESDEVNLNLRGQAKACYDVMRNLRLLQEIVNTAKGIK